MSFQSLYRKHRPQRFSEVVGQEHVTAALRNAVRDDRVGHAYLFSGPRGTGKTTTARILAKALNCTNLSDDAEPCGVCDSCVEIARGRESATVIERDAASARGVEDMRELLRGVDLSVPGRRKVYILDEVHMLTDAASNTLLKTLEEPLSHVVFVLATTEPEKVLPTIRSRTQHFQFSLLSTEEIAGHLADIAEREGVGADAEAFEIIARRGAGSVRDALSILDQALALGGGALDAASVRGVFEATPFRQRSEVIDAVAAEDPAGALTALDGLLAPGADPRHVADELLRHLRNVFLVAASRGRARVDAPDDERAELEAQGKTLGYQRVVRAIETLGEAALDMRRAPDARLVLEVALVRLARREGGTRAEVLLDRLERLEKAVEALGPGAPAAAPPVPEALEDSDSDPERTSSPTSTAPADQRPTLGAVRAREGDSASSTEEPAEVSALSPAQPAPAQPAPAQPAPADETTASASPEGVDELDLDDVILAWPQALEGMKAMLKAVAREAQPLAIEAGAVVLGLPEKLHHQRERLETGLQQVSEMLGRALGRESVPLTVTMHAGFLEEGASNSPPPSAPDGEPRPQPQQTGESDEVAGSEEVEAAGEVEEVDLSEEPVETAEMTGNSASRLIDAFDGTMEEGEAS